MHQHQQNKRVDGNERGVTGYKTERTVKKAGAVPGKWLASPLPPSEEIPQAQRAPDEEAKPV